MLLSINITGNITLQKLPKMSENQTNKHCEYYELNREILKVFN